MMRLMTAAVAAVLIAAPPASAKDRVPTRKEARSWFVREFPAAAPSALLQDERGRRFRTKRLTVVPARRCQRNRRQVECRFTVRLVPKKRGRYAPIRCRGELWGKKRNGRMIGRVGDYVCR